MIKWFCVYSVCLVYMEVYENVKTGAKSSYSKRQKSFYRITKNPLNRETYEPTIIIGAEYWEYNSISRIPRSETFI